MRDPNTANTATTDQPQTGRGVARGWIAIGNDARGVVCAVGSTAVGFVAIGGRSAGVISLGGLAVGVIAIDGLGLGMGVLAVGGGALGWQACGGGAIAWDIACGGGAVAWHAAYGGAAVARDYAVGAAAVATHANDEAAKAVLLNHTLKLGMDWCSANPAWVTLSMILVPLLLAAAMAPLMYWREREAQSSP